VPDLNRVYGIDLGTCNSAVAGIDEFDRPVTLKNDINELTTPSAVYFENETNIVVGSAAKEMAEVEPDRVIQFVKRFMGRKDEFNFAAFGKTYSPEEISGLILKALVAKVWAAAGGDIIDVVITVPAYFDDAQRTATKIAGRLAGLNVLDILNEPIAAAIAYGARTDGKPERILVYDLGGGTFDASVIDVTPGGWRILVTGGRHLLGGVNWDDRVMTYVAREFEQAHGVNPLDDPFACQDLRGKSEAAKKQLSAKTKAPIHVAFNGNKLRIELDREKFEEITADLLAETLQATRETLDDLEKKTGSRHMDRVFLVGGSSRMPMVKEAVEREFGVAAQIFDPDECVAKGAALWAVKRKIDGLADAVGYDAQTGRGNRQAFESALRKETAGMRNPKVYMGLAGKSGVNVASHTYGILAWHQGAPMVAALLPRNQPVPYTYVSGESTGTVFGTAAENQAEIEVVLMETDGDSLDPSACKEIGRGTVELPGGVPRGSEVTIRFEYAADGTMALHAQECSTGRACEVKVTRDGVMNDEEVEIAEDHLAVLTAS
jgi:molecular chaperone DnaK